MTYADDTDRFLGSIGDRAIALDKDPPPYWIEVTAKSVLENPVVEVVADYELTSPGADAHSLAYTGTRLGVASRRAACEAFGEPQADASVTRLIEEAAASGKFGDWWAAICVTARGLMAVGEGTFAVPGISELTPRRLRREHRDRLGQLMVTSILYDERGEMRDLGSLSTNAVLDCWYFGFCLSACRASLPDEAVQELSSFRDV
jgi:hypothetical protein